MGNIVLNLAVTLDGFIEGPNGEIDWCHIQEDSAAESFFDSFLPSIDTILYGRISYDLWGQYLPDQNASAGEKKLWDTVHTKKKYVFSKTPKEDGKAIFISSDIESKLTEIKKESAKDIWLYGGANLITEFINKEWVDVYLLAVYPVILGAGKPLFNNIRKRVNLTLKSEQHSPAGIVLLNYEAKR